MDAISALAFFSTSRFEKKRKDRMTGDEARRPSSLGASLTGERSGEPGSPYTRLNEQCTLDWLSLPASVYSSY